MPNEVIYLTGAPAAGKSSVSARLRDLVPSLRVWEYGQQLTAFITARKSLSLTQVEVRERSSGLATPGDIDAVDDLLLDYVRDGRETGHVIIDSHPVTKELYGFRVTPYSLGRFKQLSPTRIWVLYTSPEVALARIAANGQGRPSIGSVSVCNCPGWSICGDGY